MLALRSPAFDTDHLDRQTFGDHDLQRELLRLFAGQCRRLLPAIAGRNGEPARRDAAHALKGAARAVGAVAVADISGQLEDGAEAEAERLSAQLRAAMIEARRDVRRGRSLAKPASLA